MKNREIWIRIYFSNGPENIEYKKVLMEKNYYT